MGSGPQDLIWEAMRLEGVRRAQDLEQRVRQRFLNTELGDHFKSNSLRVAPDGSSFTLTVDMAVHYRGVDYPEGSTFTGDARDADFAQSSFY